MKYHDISTGESAPKHKALKKVLTLEVGMKRSPIISGNEKRKWQEKNNPKGKALGNVSDDFTKKKEEIRARIHPVPMSERDREIKERNKPYSESREFQTYRLNLKKNKIRPTIDERRKQISDFSRER